MIDLSTSTYHIGDCRSLLTQLPDASVQLCVTSPPFWGQRDYGHPKQIGLEPTPALYIAELVGVFREVRRVLRDDGTLWLNLGDSYAGSRSGPQGATGEMAGRAVADHRGMRSKTKGVDPKNPRVGPADNSAPHRLRQRGLKPKDLVGIPWMAAFALRDDGWWLRQDIIWSKPNPLPESVSDRCTKAHEYLFLMSKDKNYYYNGDAIAEPATWRGQNRNDTGPAPTAVPGAPPHRGLRAMDSAPPERRNKRSVWTVASQPYDGAHFAPFPPRLIEPCILACSRPGDLVLDPFFGSGTVGLVAEKHGRRWVGFDLGYEQLAKERTAQRSLLLEER